MTDAMIMVKKFIEKTYRIGSVIKRSEKAWYYTPRSNDLSQMQDILDKLPPNIGYFVDPCGQYIFAPIGTPELDYSFAEVRLVAVLGELTKRQKDVMVLMAEMNDISKEMICLKKICLQ